MYFFQKKTTSGDYLAHISYICMASARCGRCVNDKLMKDLKLLLPAVLILLSATLLPSCDKVRPDAPNRDNPPEIQLPAAAFSVRVLDHERGHHKDSAYVFEGIWRDGHFRFGRERLDTMQVNIHPGNAIVFEISSDDPRFEGVNASSSARCINIVPDGDGRTRYHLEWIAEGQSAITLWNGEGTSRREVRFVATSRQEIPMEGIRVRVDGEPRILFSGYDFALPGGVSPGEAFYPRLAMEFHGYAREDYTRHVELEIIGPEPLNANQGTLHPAFDYIGIIDHGNVHENVRPWVWLKAWNLYEENLWHNPDFRWFQPYDPGYHPDRSWDYFKLPQVYYGDPRYALNPQDLRERYAWVWPMAYGKGPILSFGEGEMELSETRNMFVYKHVHQLFINFINPSFDKVWWSSNMNREKGY